MGRKDRDPATLRSRRATNLGAAVAFVGLAGPAVLAPKVPWLDGAIGAVLVWLGVLGLLGLVGVWVWSWVAEEYESGRPRERAGIRAAWRAIGRGKGDR